MQPIPCDAYRPMPALAPGRQRVSYGPRWTPTYPSGLPVRPFMFVGRLLYGQPVEVSDLAADAIERECQILFVPPSLL